MLKFKIRRSAAVAAFILSIGSFAATGSGTASASANGCTSAPGGVGALNCVDVSGWGIVVLSADSVYNSGYNPSNVCKPQAKFKHKKNGTSSYAYKYVSASTCGLWRGYVTWSAPGAMADGRQFCATQKNSVISAYANYACIGISS